MKLKEKEKYFFKQLYKAVFECSWSSAYKDLQFFILLKDPPPVTTLAFSITYPTHLIPTIETGKVGILAACHHQSQ